MAGGTTGRGRSWAHVATDPAKNFLRRGCSWEQVFDMMAAWLGDCSTRLTAAIDELADLDVDALDDAELHELVVALGALSTRLEAAWCRLIGRWDRRQVWAADGSKAAGARLARETHLRRGDADRLVRRARDLAAMPHTEAAYAAGEINGAHVDLVASCNRQWRNADFVDSPRSCSSTCVAPRSSGSLTAASSTGSSRPIVDAADRDADTVRAAPASVGVGRRGGATVAIDGVLDPVGGEIFKTELDRICEQLRLAGSA